MSSVNYTLLEGSLPVAGLVEANTVSAEVNQKVLDGRTGTTLTELIHYYSLGKIFIDAELLEQHPVQRDRNLKHIEELVGEYENTGICRNDHSGVIIGLGDGWKQLKNTGEVVYRISKDSPICDCRATGQ